LWGIINIHQIISLAMVSIWQGYQASFPTLSSFSQTSGPSSSSAYSLLEASHWRLIGLPTSLSSLYPCWVYVLFKVPRATCQSRIELLWYHIIHKWGYYIPLYSISWILCIIIFVLYLI
jgi:hypothetical protein